MVQGPPPVVREEEVFVSSGTPGGTPAALKLVQAGAGLAVSIMGDVYTLKTTGEETNGAYAAFELFIPPLGGPPPHIHHREDEAFFILEGELHFQIGSRKIDVSAGAFLNAPKGVPHFFKNRGPQPARALTIVTPGGLEKFLLAVGRPLADNHSAPIPLTVEDLENLMAIAPDYGLEILPPWEPDGQTAY